MSLASLSLLAPFTHVQVCPKAHTCQRERECFIDNLLVRIHFIIEMIWWTGLAPWEFESSFPGSLISNVRTCRKSTHVGAVVAILGRSPIPNKA